MQQRINRLNLGPAYGVGDTENRAVVAIDKIEGSVIEKRRSQNNTVWFAGRTTPNGRRRCTPSLTLFGGDLWQIGRSTPTAVAVLEFNPNAVSANLWGINNGM